MTLPPTHFASIPPDDASPPAYDASRKSDLEKADNARPKLLREFLVGYKGVDKSCRLCPDHPLATTSWNSTRGYHYLICHHAKAQHQISMFSILGNFNLKALPENCYADLVYVLAKFKQVPRSAGCPVSYPTPVIEMDVDLATDLVWDESRYNVQAMTLAKEAGKMRGLLNVKTLAVAQQLLELRQAEESFAASPIFSSDPDSEGASYTASDMEEDFSELLDQPIQDSIRAAEEAVRRSPTRPPVMLEELSGDMVASLVQDAMMKSPSFNSFNNPSYIKEDRVGEMIAFLKESGKKLGGSNQSIHAVKAPVKVRTTTVVPSKTKPIETVNRFSSLPVEASLPEVVEAKSGARLYSLLSSSSDEERPIVKEAKLISNKTSSSSPSVSFYNNIKPAKQVAASNRAPQHASVSPQPVQQVPTGPKRVPEGYFIVPDVLGSFRRSPSCPDILPTMGEYKMQFNSPTMTFTFVSIQTEETTKGNYATVTAQHRKIEKARVLHVDKLKTDLEYAKKFVASGNRPTPVKTKTKLSVVYLPKMKPVPRNELRVILKTIDIDVKKVVDIGFRDNKSTFVIVTEDYVGTFIDKVKKLTPEARLDPFKGSCTPEELTRLGEKIEWLAKDALERGRIGLSNFHLEFGATMMASHLPPFEGECFDTTVAQMKAKCGRANIKKMAEMAIKNKMLANHTTSREVISYSDIDTSLTTKMNEMMDPIPVHGESEQSGQVGQSDLSQC